MGIHRPIVLASASPRRADLLRAAGIAFIVDVADVNESLRRGEAPAGYVQRLAEEKARAVAARHPGRIVLGADTTVVAGAAMLGKPSGPEEARAMLRQLSGRAHDVLTGVSVVEPSGRALTQLSVSTVCVARLAEAEIEWYVASAEPLDKAGAYAIQGLASRFVTRIEGSYTNVVGLPVALVYEMLRSVHDGAPVFTRPALTRGDRRAGGD